MKQAIAALVAAVCLITAAIHPAYADGVKKAALPFVIFGAAKASGANFYPSGWMGNTGAIKMDEKSADNPHGGATSLKFQYTANDNWAGIVWQNPDNNWGDKEGGFDLSGAKTLSFWARGASGGEVVSFSFGLIGKDKANSDSATGKLDKVTLTKDWKKYTIDLSGKDMSHIITGFCWVVAGSGSPVTFYLDDARYE